MLSAVIGKGKEPPSTKQSLFLQQGLWVEFSQGKKFAVSSEDSRMFPAWLLNHINVSIKKMCFSIREW